MFVLIELWSMSQCPCGDQLQLNYIKILPCIFKTHIKKKRYHCEQLNNKTCLQPQDVLEKGEKA